MRIIGVQRRVSPFLIAVVLLLQLSPALAIGQPDAQEATVQGSRPVEVTFTKWPTTGLPPLPAVPGRTLFQGFVGGDLGDGEVPIRKARRPRVGARPSATVPCPDRGRLRRVGHGHHEGRRNDDRGAIPMAHPADSRTAPDRGG